MTEQQQPRQVTIGGTTYQAPRPRRQPPTPPRAVGVQMACNHKPKRNYAHKGTPIYTCVLCGLSGPRR